MVPGPAADPQASQATPVRGRASSRAEPSCLGRYHLRAAHWMSVESAGCHRAWLGLDRASPVPGVGPGRAVLPAVAGGPGDTMRCMGLTGAGLRTLTLPGRGRPDSAPTILAGVGAFAPEDSYGLGGSRMHADLPDGLTLAPDDWDEPYLRLTGDTQASQITSLWRACARVWRQTVEFLGSGT